MTMLPNQNQHILEGSLNHVIETRSALRWVVLERNPEQGHVYLSIYRKTSGARTEADLKSRYELTPSNFVGTERGTIKDGGRNNVLYWAIILKGETILFKDKESVDKTRSQFEKWNDVVKQLWKHQSWEVSPVEGEAIEDHPKLILHLNSTSLCLALLSPPRHYLRWSLSNVTRCECTECRFSFHITGKDKPGFYEVKVTRAKHASKIKSVCQDLRQGMTGVPRLIPKPPSRTPSVDNAGSPVELLEEINNRLASRRASSENRISDSSTGSAHSLQMERDSGSIASFDSVQSTPSPPPHKSERESKPINPFVFPSHHVNGVTDGAGQSNLCVQPSDKECRTQTPTALKPRMAASPRGHQFQAENAVHYHVAYINAKSLSGMSKSPVPGAIHDRLIKSPVPGAIYDGQLCHGNEAPSTRHVVSLHPQAPPPPPTFELCLPSPDPVTLSSEPSKFFAMASESRATNSAGLPSSLLSTSVVASTSMSSLSSYSQSPEQSIPILRPLSCPAGGHTAVHQDSADGNRLAPTKSQLRPTKRQTSHENEGTYMNTFDGTERVDLSTEPVEQPTYMNVAEEHSHYQNPPLDQLRRAHFIKDPVGPRVPPRTRPPRVPPRHKRYELHELVEKAKGGNLQVTNLVDSFSVLKQFCNYLDVKKNSYPLKDWRALAERVGLTISDIELVNQISHRASTATEIVLAYWESNCPDDMPYTLDQLVKELESLDRQDLIDILRKKEGRSVNA